MIIMIMSYAVGCLQMTLRYDDGYDIEYDYHYHD